MMTFEHDEYEVGCGGTEIPMTYSDGKTYLYMWNKTAKNHVYYVRPDDIFIADTEAPWLRRG